MKQLHDGSSITGPQLVVTFFLGLYFPSSYSQNAKKGVSDSPGLVDFAIGLVNSVINLPDGQVNFLGGNSNYRRTVINPAHQIFGGLVEMTFGLVHASYSLPEWQAVKLTFFAP